MRKSKKKNSSQYQKKNIKWKYKTKNFVTEHNHIFVIT